MVRQFQFKWLSEIEDLLCEEGDLKFGGSSHDTLGLVRAFNKVMRTVEADMELKKLVQTFMVGRNARSVAG